MTDTMVFMLPISDPFGLRLAEVMPSALSLLTGEFHRGLAPLQHVVVMVVDGLGWHNFQARRGHARAIASLEGEAISTVFPTTTGAALTTITTGTLPGRHGLVGYRIRHPHLGLRTTLSEWDGIEDVRSWQLAPTVFEQARKAGVAAHVIGRSAHQTGGLTRAILTGATYSAADTIEARCDEAIRLLRDNKEQRLIYLYIDELDRAGHRNGWQSDAWIHRLEQLDVATHELLKSLPAQTGFVLTADHGMLDVASGDHIILDADPHLLDGVSALGGEPRLRYLYLEDQLSAAMVASKVQKALGDRAIVATREEIIEADWFGPPSPSVAERIGDVILIAQGGHAFFVSSEAETSMRMVGHHGGISEQEREVPLLVAGAIPWREFIPRP